VFNSDAAFNAVRAKARSPTSGRHAPQVALLNCNSTSHEVRISPTNTIMTSIIDSLRKQISTCESTLQDLRRQLVEAEHIQRQQARVVPKKTPLATDPTNPLDHDMNFGVPDDFRSEIFAVLEQEAKASEENPPDGVSRWPLEKSEYKRYGRQLIMPEIGLQGK
jgi:adenylyltransferase/sulfurtransferase